MDPKYIDEYEGFELNHWWFVARRQIICDALDHYAPGARRWLDVGCGTGVLLNAYSQITQKVGIEVDSACVERAKAKGLDVRVARQDWDLTQLGQFSLVTMCDVLEHLNDDAGALNKVAAALEENGVLLVTVPAMPSLWSDHDVINQHFRRYTRKTLRELFDSPHWDVQRISYFSSLLLPMIGTARMLKNLVKRRKNQPTHDFHFGSKWIDRILLMIFRLERPLLRRMNLPLGSSLLLIARKKSSL